ncbi:MAG: STAS domain-containing protein [Chloroflexi bacterium]|nr:STAS domain-containing protein [Chloroflexota bacterium]
MSSRRQLQITKVKINAVTIISVTGSVDALTAPMLAEYLAREIQNPNPNLVIDFAELDYTSSAGLRVLLSAVKAARARGGDVRLAAMQTNVAKIFEMSGFNAILKVYPDRARAVASFAA